MTLISTLFIGLGGAIGTMIRYGIAVIFPSYAILLVNIIGSLLIGMLLQYLSLKTSLSQTVYLFLTVGLLGGFTTFSAFSVETIFMIDNHKYLTALFYVAASVGGALMAFLLGRYLVRLML